MLQRYIFILEKANEKHKKMAQRYYSIVPLYDGGNL